MKNRFVWFGREGRREFFLYKVDGNCKILENHKAYATIDFNNNGKYGAWCVFLAHKVRRMISTETKRAYINPNMEMICTADSVKTGETLNVAMSYGFNEVDRYFNISDGY